MKQILRLLFLLLAATTGLNCYAGDKNEITLTVTSDGPTKDDAIKNALRSAIEQAYGVFVSANTDILNDDLVKDEIATISSGNIKKFTEVAYTKNENIHTVTLGVVVSKGKLLSYAKSKGAECELDGKSMFADIQLQELYKQNEERLFENLCREFEQLIMNGYDYKLDVKQADNSYTGYIGSGYGSYNPNADPENNVCLECRIFVKLNEQGELAWNKLLKILKEVGRPYNPNKCWGSAVVSQEFPYTVLIFKPSWGSYNGHYNCDYFKVRSRRSEMLLSNLMQIIPYIVKNVSIEYAGKQLDISEDLSFLHENHSDGTLVCLNNTRPYSRKKGSNCGEYRYFLNIPKAELKDVRGISVSTNEKLD